MHAIQDNENPRVSEYVAEMLRSKGVEQVFVLSGGMIMQILDSIFLGGDIDIVTVHHEQAAAFAADAVGRLSGIPGVAIATSGPGAINLLTGVGSCFFDSSPAVFITGQVNRNEQKRGKSIRQLGFQETDIVSMAGQITKFAHKIECPEEIPAVLEKAFEIASEGRPGPVLIDIPMDVARARIDAENAIVPVQTIAARTTSIDESIICTLLGDLEKSARPLILAGGGVRASGSTDLLRKTASRLGIPVVYSLLACDSMTYDDPHRVGMIGTYGNRWANICLGMADPLIVLGSRLDIRQTGADTVSFKGHRTIYHVDIEEAEINNRVSGCRAIVADVNDFLTKLLICAESEDFEDRLDWTNEIKHLREKWPDTEELRDAKGINPNVVMHRLSASAHAAVYAVDVGQHQMWAAQSLEIYEGQRFITSGGMGAMGYALPAAIGASCLYKHRRPIVAIAGDAGFQLNIQELQTVVRNEMPIKMVVVNNRCHGMTRQFQETYFAGRYPATIWGYDTPDFAEIARAYGIRARTVSEESELDVAIAEMWDSRAEPYLLQVMVDSYTDAYPKLAFGRTISEMEPFAKPIEMEGT